MQAVLTMAMVAVTYGAVTIKDSPGLQPADQKIEKDFIKPSLNVIQPRTNMGTTHIPPEYYTDPQYREDCHRMAENKAQYEAMVQHSDVIKGPKYSYEKDGNNFFVNWDQDNFPHKEDHNRLTTKNIRIGTDCSGIEAPLKH